MNLPMAVEAILPGDFILIEDGLAKPQSMKPYLDALAVECGWQEMRLRSEHCWAYERGASEIWYWKRKRTVKVRLVIGKQIKSIFYKAVTYDKLAKLFRDEGSLGQPDPVYRRESKPPPEPLQR